MDQLEEQLIEERVQSLLDKVSEKDTRIAQFEAIDPTLKKFRKDLDILSSTKGML